MWSVAEHKSVILWKVTDAGVSALGAGCSQLQSVNLSGCGKVTDAGVSAFRSGVITGRGQSRYRGSQC